MLEPLQWIIKGLEQLETYYGSSGIPGSCLWATKGILREQMDIQVTKIGRGVQILYGNACTKGFEMENFVSRLKVPLVGIWAIRFGTPSSPSDFDLTQRLISITVPWSNTDQKYVNPWEIALRAMPWRSGEEGETVPEAGLVDASWDGSTTETITPMCSADPPTSVEATRTREIQALLKFGRDSGWPLKINAAVEIDQQISLSIAYDSD
jgi:hypothetical protein